MVLRVTKRRGLIQSESADHYLVIKNFGVGGATLKDVLQDPLDGSFYIAKLGTRNSDLEVLTEYAIYLIGRSLGIETAVGKIAEFRGQLRFFSRYFLVPEKQEELVHGMQLFKELYDDTTVVSVIGDQLQEQRMFSVQAVEAAFGAHYLHYGSDVVDRLFDGFVAMLTHDALIGVQDRHHENWGVVVQRSLDAPPPRFSPLYDSARGLFCNERDPDLVRKFAGVAGSQRLDGFVARSRPLVGFVGLDPIQSRKYVTHDQLIGQVFRVYPRQRQRIQSILDAYDWRAVRSSLSEQLGSRWTPARIQVILNCLRRRVRLINRSINAAMS